MTAYKNFRVAVYSRAFETAQMGDLEWLTPIWEKISKQVHVDRIFLETHRDLVIVDDATLNTAKTFFQSKGVETAGGITLTISEPHNFKTFDYANPSDRAKVQEIVEHTAKHFDELILDDFFFTNSKSVYAIEAKGNKSWSEFRLELMTTAAKELIIGPAKSVNPKCKVVIKYPNWYDHFQGLGFNLADEPRMFDGLYTGTETRDPSSPQHLQPYHGYSIFRYFENLKPGHNNGGWVDIFGSDYLDRYAEQLWLTMFAKAPEITLFDFMNLQKPISESSRAEWQDTPGTSFVYDDMIASIADELGSLSLPATYASAAGYSLKIVDKFLGELGSPIGVKAYKPYHAIGEDFLHSFLGMIGIPIDIVPDFPVDERICLITEHAASDTEIVTKIKKQLIAGKDVMITSGFLKEKQEQMSDIVELRYTNHKAYVNRFKQGWFIDLTIDDKILIPQIKYLTNDSWELVSCLDGDNGWPILLRSDFGNGSLYVLTIPENMEDLYKLPRMVTSKIKHTLTKGMDVMLDGPGKTSIFVYDNNTVIVESFNDIAVQVTLRTIASINTAKEILSNENYQCMEVPVLEGGWFDPPTIYHGFTMQIAPHSFKVIRLQSSKLS